MFNNTINKVMAEPFIDKSVKTELKGESQVKVAVLRNDKTRLVKLRVLANAFDSNRNLVAMEGSHIMVRADGYAQSWGKDIFEIDEVKFVLIPLDRVEVFVLSDDNSQFSLWSLNNDTSIVK